MLVRRCFLERLIVCVLQVFCLAKAAGSSRPVRASPAVKCLLIRVVPVESSRVAFRCCRSPLHRALSRPVLHRDGFGYCHPGSVPWRRSVGSLDGESEGLRSQLPWTILGTVPQTLEPGPSTARSTDECWHRHSQMHYNK